MVRDVKQSVQFYTEVLGFSLAMAVPESQDVILDTMENKNIVYALIQHGNTHIMFQEESTFKQDLPTLSWSDIGATVAFYFEVQDIKKVYQSIQEKNPILKEMYTTWYGMNEFYIADPDGYILGFAELKNKQ